MQTQLVHASAVEWRPLAEAGVSGISVKVLRYDAAVRRAPTILLKFEPGASYPAHDHPGGEEIFVLEGAVTVGKERLTVGDYLYTPPGGTHAVWSPGGCVLLLIVPEQVVILKKQS